MKKLTWVLLALLAFPAMAQNVVPGPAINPACNAQTGAYCTVWTPAQWVTAWQSVVSAYGGYLTNGQLFGTTVNNGTISGGTVSANVSGSTVLATGSTTARTLAARTADRINVLDWGLDPTGATDNTALFQAMVTATTGLSPRGEYWFPAGIYEFNSAAYVADGWIVETDGATKFTGTGGLNTLADTSILLSGIANKSFESVSSADVNAFGVYNSLVAGLSSGTANYEKSPGYDAALSYDPSTYTTGTAYDTMTKSTDVVGRQMAATIANTNTVGRAWGFTAGAGIAGGGSGDGFLVGGEIDLYQYGVNQSQYSRHNSKTGLQVVNFGPQNSTVQYLSLGHTYDAFAAFTGDVSRYFLAYYNTGSWPYTTSFAVDGGGNITSTGTLGVSGAATVGSLQSGANIAANGSVYALTLNGVGSANTIGLNGNSTGNPVVVGASGTDANISITYSTKGTGQHLFSGNIVGYSGLFLNVSGGTLPTSAGLAQSGAGLGLWWNETGAGAESDFIAYRTSGEAGGFAWYDYTIGGSPTQIATMSKTGALAVPSISLTAYTSSSIGGSSLAAGACASTTVAITGLTTAMIVDTTPATYPGDAYFWKAYASAAGTATVKVCAAIAGTPTASTYNLRVIQ